MKRTICRILCVAMLLCMALAMTGCGQDGTYLLKEVSCEGVSVSPEDAGLDAGDYYVQLNADGTGVLCLDGEVSEIQWGSNKLWLPGNEDNALPFQISDGVLTLKVTVADMIFEKE